MVLTGKPVNPATPVTAAAASSADPPCAGSNGDAAEKNAEEIHQAGPHDCVERLQRIGVNHRRDSVRRVMKSI